MVDKEKNRNFYGKVYHVVRKIPHGRVTSYGAIANFIGSPRSARMVGWAMFSSHNNSTYVPAHRVVNRNGLLTGKHHFETPNLMKELLENEGVVIKNNQIQNFDLVFWNPSKYLKSSNNFVS